MCSPLAWIAWLFCVLIRLMKSFRIKVGLLLGPWLDSTMDSLILRLISHPEMSWGDARGGYWWLPPSESKSLETQPFVPRVSAVLTKVCEVSSVHMALVDPLKYLSQRMCSYEFLCLAIPRNSEKPKIILCPLEVASSWDSKSRDWVHYAKLPYS